MSLSMYDVCVPALSRGLNSLRSEFKKADAYVAAQEIKPASLLNFRLFPNMLPLKSQAYIATDTAKFSIKRLGEIDVPSFTDDQETFPELDERIGKTLDFLTSVTPEQLNGTEEKEITMKRKTGDIKLTGQQYLLGFVLPNFYFHVATAHAILRHNGVDIAKGDYLGRP